MKMYKRIFGVLLCLCMLLGAVSLAGAEEENTDSHSHALCYGTACTDPAHSSHSDVTFAKAITMADNVLCIGGEKQTPNSNSSDNYEYTLSEGTYYLDDNLTLNKGIQVQGNVTLCLNGHKITCDKFYVIQMLANSRVTFTLCDCIGTGAITHTANSTSNAGGVILGGSGAYTDNSFIMYNGCITGNKISGVYLQDKASFTMYGGSITQNGYNNTYPYGVYGGGVYVHTDATFTMYGGNITGNYADTNGGGVHVGGDKTFTMYGGSITGNHTRGNGGGVNVNAGTITVGGNVNISGNWKGDENSSISNNNANNVYLSAYDYSSKFATITIEKALTGEQPIGVTTANAPTAGNPVTIVTGNSIQEKDKNYFQADDAAYGVSYNSTDKVLQLHAHSGGMATCTAKAVCTTCDQSYGNINPNNHDLEHHDAKAATCTEKGWNAYDTCKHEGCTYTTYVEIPALDHDFKNSTIYRYDGDQHWKKCANCNAEDTANKENHTGGTANCIEKAVCTSCNQEYGGLNSSNHKSDVGLWKGDNGVDGQHWKEYLCCHVRVSVGTHQWDAGVEVTPATCTTIGRKTFTCEVCGQKRDGEITALNHDLVHHEAKAATCTEIGWEAYDTCKREGCNYTTYEAIGMLAHDFANGTYLSDDTQHWKQCKNCTEISEKTKHTVVIDAAKPATTTETGLTEGKHCSVCGKVLVAQEVTPKLPRYYYNSTTATTKDTTKKDTTKSPGTFDPGVGVYALTAVLSVTGMAWMGRKKH